ncbi:MAG: hypothetical protein M3Y50_10475 [Acidobacteriota bacterium]|nr:hypothetical protein [Acidobacteriota bacterium]
MARMTDHPPPSWTPAQSRAQFAALAQLRWCLFRNAFRRKGGVGELTARIVFLPVIGIAALGPIVGAGFAAYSILYTHHLQMLPALTWSIFALWIIVSINIAPPGQSFDIDSILRFPVSFPRYLATRLFFGLLSASTVIGTLALISADIGIGIAQPALLPWATLLLAVFAMANILLTRMVFAWVDRWLSTRRARELLTGLGLLVSLGFQYLNVTLNPGLQNNHHRASHLPLLLRIFHRLQPATTLLPPGLTASSIAAFDQKHFAPASASLCGLLACGALFLAVYAQRMRREFRGENLSEQLTKKRVFPRPNITTPPPPAHADRSNPFGISPALAACLRKELLCLRRNTNQLYGFFAPIFMVFLFAGRIGASGRFGAFTFPAAVAYSVLGVAILSYNNLGMDGAGIQFYFFAPARMRDVFLAKNLIGFTLNLIELFLIYLVVAFTASTPSLRTTLATVCWLSFAALINTAIGNLRSLTAPKKIDLSKISRKQTSPLSALISLGVMLLSSGVGCAVVSAAHALKRPWLMVPALLMLAVGALLFYLKVLTGLDVLALTHRETLTAELSKA